MPRTALEHFVLKEVRRLHLFDSIAVTMVIEVFVFHFADDLRNPWEAEPRRQKTDKT